MNDPENLAAALYAESTANHNLAKYDEASRTVYIAIGIYVDYKYPSIMRDYKSLNSNELIVDYMTRCTFPIDKTLSNYVLQYAHEETIRKYDIPCKLYALAARLGGTEAIGVYRKLQIDSLCW